MILAVILFVSFSFRCFTCVPAVNMSVRREQNVSLTCDSSNFTDSSSVMAWYRLHSEEITLLVSAERGKLKPHDFIVLHNDERGHVELEADGRLESVRLVISAVRETDLGLYFCAAGVGWTRMHFGTAVRLTFADAERWHSSDGGGCRSLWICACVACGICGFLCACVLRYRKNSSAVSCISCVKENSNVQAAQVQYSSLRFIRRSRAAAPAPGNVTYATIATHTP